jgi:hypothetical protein
VTERCFVKVEFDPATSGSQVRRAVGGFLRYIQHRDLHPNSRLDNPKRDVAGLVKYVAYRDKASARAELFGSQGSFGTKERKEFVGFVARSLEGSKPQIFRTRSGLLMDRRRAVSRFLISPEAALGLDLERLTRAAVSRLESDMGVTGLRWIAAIHRNTDHHHVHLVMTGLRADASGNYRRVDVSKARLAAMKLAVGIEIERQRGERETSRAATLPAASDVKEGESPALLDLKPRVTRPVLIRALPSKHYSRHGTASTNPKTNAWRPDPAGGSILALRAVARRYQRRMEHELEIEARRLGRERAA